MATSPRDPVLATDATQEGSTSTPRLARSPAASATVQVAPSETGPDHAPGARPTAVVPLSPGDEAVTLVQGELESAELAGVGPRDATPASPAPTHKSAASQTTAESGVSEGDRSLAGDDGASGDEPRVEAEGIGEDDSPSGGSPDETEPRDPKEPRRRDQPSHLAADPEPQRERMFRALTQLEEIRAARVLPSSDGFLLEHPTLGRVHLEIDEGPTGVSVRLRAASSEGQRALERLRGELRQALEEAGITVRTLRIEERQARRRPAGAVDLEA